MNENEIVPPLNEDNFNKSPMSQTFIENENNYVCDNTTEQKKEPDHSNNSDVSFTHVLNELLFYKYKKRKSHTSHVRFSRIRTINIISFF